MMKRYDEKRKNFTYFPHCYKVKHILAFECVRG